MRGRDKGLNRRCVKPHPAHLARWRARSRCGTCSHTRGRTRSAHARANAQCARAGHALTIFNCPGFRLQLAFVAADWMRETLISSQPSAIVAGRALPFPTKKLRGLSDHDGPTDNSSTPGVSYSCTVFVVGNAVRVSGNRNTGLHTPKRDIGVLPKPHITIK